MTREALAVIDAAVREYRPSHLFALFSGGHDSLTATAITAQHPRFTAAVHINTGIGSRTLPRRFDFLRSGSMPQAITIRRGRPPRRTCRVSRCVLIFLCVFPAR